nr:putative thylakoidal processing peptidase 2, chloroplastic [Quercus suber]
MKMAVVESKFDQKSGWLSKILNFCSEDAKAMFSAVTMSILFKSFLVDPRKQMSLLNSDLKLAAQILGLVIVIITLRRLFTNNTATATATQILPDGVTNSSSQDNIQMIALNFDPV